MKRDRRSVAWAAGLLALAAGPAAAGIDAPGSVSFQWLSEQEQVLREFPDIPEDEPYFEARAFFSSDASTFGTERGVLIWAGFELIGPAGPGYGMLLIDLDLTYIPPDLDTPLQHGAVRAEYVETFGGEVTFEGQVVTGDVWLLDVVFHEDDKGAIEGDFAMIFAGMDPTYPGSRVFMRGRFITSPSPARVVGGHRTGYGDEGEVVYVDTGCSGDVYLADDTGEGCDCGGTDPDPDSGGGGCEGDTGSGCGGDGGGGCEGDTGGGCAGSGSSGGCSGDVSGGGACSGADACSHTGAAFRPGRNGRPLNTLIRLFPEIAVLLFIWGLRRRV